MKKDRSAFFQNNSASSYYYPGPNMMGTNGYGAYPMATESNSNFYQGPAMMPVYSQGADVNSELESRLAKIERQINRLDSRVTKLESETTIETNTNNGMYMV